MPCRLGKTMTKRDTPELTALYTLMETEAVYLLVNASPEAFPFHDLVIGGISTGRSGTPFDPLCSMWLQRSLSTEPSVEPEIMTHFGRRRKPLTNKLFAVLHFMYVDSSEELSIMWYSAVRWLLKQWNTSGRPLSDVCQGLTRSQVLTVSRRGQVAWKQSGMVRLSCLGI